jgi:flagellar motor switch/type III secretory pathway protein FliN
MLEFDEPQLGYSSESHFLTRSSKALSPDDASRQVCARKPAFDVYSRRYTEWKNVLAGRAGVELEFDLPADGTDASAKCYAHIDLLTGFGAESVKELRRLNLSCGDAKFCAYLLPHISWAEATNAAFPSLPQELQDAVSAHLTSRLRHALSSFLTRLGLNPGQLMVGLRTGLDAHQGASAELSAEPHWLVRIAVKCGLDCEAQCALVDFAAVSVLPKLAGWLQPRKPFNARLPIELRLARKHLSAAQVKTLQVADVLVLKVEESGRLGFSGCLVVAGHVVGSTQFNTVEVTQVAIQSMEIDRSSEIKRRYRVSEEHSEVGVKSDRLLDVLDIQVDAVIELPPARISEIQQWNAGTIISLNRQADQEYIKLRVSGREAGRGRLVSVEGVLGLEITELFD